MKAIDIGNGQTITFADITRQFSVKGAAYGETDQIVSTKTTITIPDKLGISGGFSIVPDGFDNKFGYQLAQLLEDNNLGLGVIRRQRGLQYGQGLALYTVKYEQGKRIVDWFADKAIDEWLDTWDYEEYLLNSLLDLLIKQEYYTKIIPNKGSKMGVSSAKITLLEHVNAVECRRQWPDENGKYDNIFVADWRSSTPEKIFRYPVFKPEKGTATQASMVWTSFYQFGH